MMPRIKMSRGWSGHPPQPPHGGRRIGMASPFDDGGEEFGRFYTQFQHSGMDDGRINPEQHYIEFKKKGYNF